VATSAPAVMAAAPCEKIGFQKSGPARSSDIWIMDSDGANKTNLTNNPVGAFSTQPDWSPDGTRLAYIGLPLGAGTYDVFVSDANGGNPKNVTNYPATTSGLSRQPYGVHWSPDGQRIAFTLTTLVARAGQSFSDVWVMDADGKNQINVTNKESTHSDAGFLAWSPDSTRIAIKGYGSNNQDIWAVNPNTSELVQITNTDPSIDTSNNGAYFSPDGKRIGYTQHTQFASGFDDIWISDIDGTHQSKITNTTVRGTGYQFAGWSSDGQKIAFLTVDAATFVDVWVSDPDGSNRLNITNAAAGTSYYNASWSPSGSGLSFLKLRTVRSPIREDFSDIVVAEHNGSSLAELTQNPANSIQLKKQSWVRCPSDSSTVSSSTSTTSTTSTTTRIVPEIVGGQTSTTTSQAPTVPITTTTTTSKPLALVFLPIPTATTTTVTPTTTTSPTTSLPTTTIPSAPATFNVGPTTIPIGGTITLTGSGFQPGTEATFELHSTITPLGKATVNPNGTFTYQSPTPPLAEPGTHEVVVNGISQQGKPATLSAPLTILGPTPTAAPTPPTPAPSVLGTEEVAYTGNGTTAGPITAGAMAMILTGAYLLIHNRQRRKS
jgi:Tol biopolymer transport system component